jgi:hypothetical protein
MRKSTVFFTYIGVLLGFLGLVAVHSTLAQKCGLAHLRQEAEMVKALSLTDLCLFTEASYTRHLSQADLNTAFQDSPMALEHFPSGSLVTPPGRAGSNGPADACVCGIGSAGMSVCTTNGKEACATRSCEGLVKNGGRKGRMRHEHLD